MPQGEGVIVNGGGSQTSREIVAGDYTSMNVDPKDDCTFWYTNEYYAATSSTGYATRVGTFVFPGCRATRNPIADFDGDSKTDLSIFRPGPGEWWYQRSGDQSASTAQFGASTDKIVPFDYTGDGKADLAFFRPSTGYWFILRSEDFSFFAFPFGVGTDIRFPAIMTATARRTQRSFDLRPQPGISIGLRAVRRSSNLV